MNTEACDHENAEPNEAETSVCSDCKEHCCIVTCPDCEEDFGSDCCGT